MLKMYPAYFTQARYKSTIKYISQKANFFFMGDLKGSDEGDLKGSDEEFVVHMTST